MSANDPKRILRGQQVAIDQNQCRLLKECYGYICSRGLRNWRSWPNPKAARRQELRRKSPLARAEHDRQM